jgi:hypothetical protein
MQHTKRLRALFLCLHGLLLASCGEGGGAPTSPSIIAAPFNPANGTGSAYYPMLPGTQIVYQVSPVTSLWNSATHSLAIQTRGTVVNAQTLQYSLNYCVDFGGTPLFASTYNSGVLNAAAPFVAAQALQDTLFTSANQIDYIGEGENPDGEVQPGEAKITMQPVVGEIIDANSAVTPGCGNRTLLNAAYHWRYQTIEHLANWRGYADVWHTGLIEFNGGSTPSAVYNYWFARGIGMVSFVWGNPLDAATNLANGYEYYAVPH